MEEARALARLSKGSLHNRSLPFNLQMADIVVRGIAGRRSHLQCLRSRCLCWAQSLLLGFQVRMARVQTKAQLVRTELGSRRSQVDSPTSQAQPLVQRNVYHVYHLAWPI